MYITSSSRTAQMGYTQGVYERFPIPTKGRYTPATRAALCRAARSYSTGTGVLIQSQIVNWLKRTVQRDFRPPDFFIIRPGLGQWVKIVSFLVSFSPRYSNFSNLRAVSYCTKLCDFSISFFKGQSNEIFYLFFFNSGLPWPLSNG